MRLPWPRRKTATDTALAARNVRRKSAGHKGRRRS